MESIRLDNIPALHLAKLYQTQVYLQATVDGFPPQKTGLYSLPAQSSAIHFNQDSLLFRLENTRSPTYLHLTLFDKNNTYLGNLNEIVITA